MHRFGSTFELQTLGAACCALALACLAPVSATAAEPTSLVELDSFSDAEPPAVYGLSADGSTPYGSSRIDVQSVTIGSRPVRWNANGEGSPLPVPASHGDIANGASVAASFDGSVIVGFAERYEAGIRVGTAPMRWIGEQSADLDEFEEDGQGKRTAFVRDVSTDGSLLCGTALRFDATSSAPLGRDAVRWNASGDAVSLQSLGSDETGQQFAWATVISGDGTTVGGSARKFVGSTSVGDLPVLWSADGTVRELAIAPARIAAKSGEVNVLSFDGSRAFGTLDSDLGNNEPESPVAVLWRNATAPLEIGPRTAFNDAPPYSDVLVGCSEAGTRAVGHANLSGRRRGFVWTEGQGIVDLGTLYPNGSTFVGSSIPKAISADGSTIVGVSSNGGAGVAFVWRNSPMRSLSEALQAAGVDLAAEGWQSFDDAVACSSDGSVIVGIGKRFGKTVGYRAKINDAPTLAAPTPTVVECTGGQNFVELTATANDANSADRLTVTWKVDGALWKTFPNVMPGSVVKFGHDYEDGAHTVSVEVTDGLLKATASTTVTVADTTAPSIVVAPDVVIPTDAGKASASGVKLAPPSVADLCDGDPELTNDAPSVFPLGPTIVKWTAEDDDGNVAVGNQRVTVVDREKPRITGPRAVTVPCDRGQTFATVQLAPAQASDNVPQGLKVRASAPARYPIGVSTASWTATDAAGNQATWSTKVTVRNAPPVANAGKNVTVTTTSERGARVTLSGTRSSDPDGHSLKYRWSAPGVRFVGPTKAKTTGSFPVGSKTVKLTVTDEAGTKRTDTVRVTVKLKNAKRRPRGAASNAAFAEVLRLSTEGASARAPDASRASGLLHAAAAHRLAIELGDHVRQEEGESEEVALLRYAERRELQRLHGDLAARRFLASFLETGDEASLLAGLHAIRGVAHAADDLTQR